MVLFKHFLMCALISAYAAGQEYGAPDPMPFQIQSSNDFSGSADINTASASSQSSSSQPFQGLDVRGSGATFTPVSTPLLGRPSSSGDNSFFATGNAFSSQSTGSGISSPTGFSSFQSSPQGQSSSQSSGGGFSSSPSSGGFSSSPSSGGRIAPSQPSSGGFSSSQSTFQDFSSQSPGASLNIIPNRQGSTIPQGQSSFSIQSGQSKSAAGGFSHQNTGNSGISNQGSSFGSSSSSQVENFKSPAVNNNFGSSSSQLTSGSASGPGGVDFSKATRQPNGKLCVVKFEQVESLAKDPILECTHKNIEKCHYTYKTQFKTAQEEVCDENFEKLCQITFKKQASKEKFKKCYRPQRKVCNGRGPVECRTVYESSCTTRYIPKLSGKFVGDTKCEKLPVEICGAGCVTEEGPEECHEKEHDTLIDVPEENCDLNPQKTCRFVTRLVPSLAPQRECTIVPQEVCNLKFSNPRKETKPLKSEWCLDESPTVRDTESYGDNV